MNHFSPEKFEKRVQCCTPSLESFRRKLNLTFFKDIGYHYSSSLIYREVIFNIFKTIHNSGAYDFSRFPGFVLRYI